MFAQVVRSAPLDSERKEFRPTTGCVWARVAASLIVICAAAFSICCALRLDAKWQVAGNALIVILALCHVADGFYARLTLDGEAIEVRTLNVSGPDIYWLDPNGKGAAKTARVIENWRRTLMFDGSAIARGVAKPRLQRALWPLLIFCGSYVAWEMRDAPELVLIAAAVLVSPMLWWMRLDSRLANEPMTIPGITGGSAKWRIVLFVIAAFAANTAPVEVADPAAGRRLAIGLTVCVILALWPLLFRWRPAGAVFTAALAGILYYCFGGAILANAAFDRSAPVRHAYVVAEKHLERRSNGRGNVSYIHWITLRSSDEYPEGKAFAVGQPLYVSLALGGSVCRDVREGSLGVAWYPALYKCGGPAPAEVGKR